MICLEAGMWSTKKVLAPVDLSSCSRTALQWAERFARTAGAQLNALYVIRPSAVTVPNITVQQIEMPQRTLQEVIRSEALSEFDGFIEAALGHGGEFVGRRLVWGEPVQRIPQYAIERKYDLIVMSGPHAGRHIFKNSVITPAALPFVKGDLKTLGLELARFSDLSSRLEELLDLKVEVSKRTRGEYTNVYFIKRIQIAGEAPREPAPDDTPF